MAAKFSYNKSIEEMERIMAEIEVEDIDIDKLSEKVKRLSELIKTCKKHLYATEDEVQNIINELSE